jgi:hypothetical protein
MYHKKINVLNTQYQIISNLSYNLYFLAMSHYNGTFAFTKYKQWQGSKKTIYLNQNYR